MRNMRTAAGRIRETTMIGHGRKTIVVAPAMHTGQRRANRNADLSRCTADFFLSFLPQLNHHISYLCLPIFLFIAECLQSAANHNFFIACNLTT